MGVEWDGGWNGMGGGMGWGVEWDGGWNGMGGGMGWGGCIEMWID